MVQEFYRSKDGTNVPMFITRAKNAPAEPAPTFLYGYGGFSISLKPGFNLARLLFIKHFGGVGVVANIRGGQEYGESWHEAGTKQRKQNVFDDFIAAAEHLISTNVTRPDLLAINGGYAHLASSNSKILNPDDEDQLCLYTYDCQVERWSAGGGVHQPEARALRGGRGPSRRARHAALPQVHHRVREGGQAEGQAGLLMAVCSIHFRMSYL